MELIEGATLDDRLRGPKFSTGDARRVGLAIASGIAHIHDRGMEHGDLWEANILITDSTIKVIDILYKDSLAMLSTGTRTTRLRRDLTQVKLLLQHIIMHSALPSADATKFSTLMGENPSVLDIRDAFLKIIDAATLTENERLLVQVHERLTDEGFVKGKASASALLEDRPPTVRAQVLTRMVNKRSYGYRHRDYVLAAWTRLSAEERSAFLSHLGAELEKELPKGRWFPLLAMFDTLKVESWSALTPRFRVRLEQLIIKDVLSGYEDAKGRSAFRSGVGSIGTFALNLWPHFAKPYQLAENLMTLLRRNEHSQNYVARYFFSVLPDLAEQTRKTDQMIRAIKGAVDDGTQLVIAGLENLPEEWVARISPEGGG